MGPTQYCNVAASSVGRLTISHQVLQAMGRGGKANIRARHPDNFSINMHQNLKICTSSIVFANSVVFSYIVDEKIV